MAVKEAVLRSRYNGSAFVPYIGRPRQKFHNGLLNTAEGGTSGATVTAANSGGLSGDAWASNPTVASATCTYSNAAFMHGTNSYLFTYSSGGTGLLTWNFSYPITDRFAMRAYFRVSTLAGSPLLMGAFANTDLFFFLALDSSGHINYINDPGTAIFVGSYAISVNTWYRLEASVIPASGTGVMQLALYAGDSMTVLDSYSGSAESLGGNPVTTVVFGTNEATSAALNLNFDDLGCEVVASGFLGPTS